jgi:hypothetical protein
MIEVEVTALDIMLGKPDSTTQCPVALAIKRATNRKINVRVSEDWLNVGRYSFYLPLKVSAFIQKFDQHKKGKPIKFGIPSEMVKS